ncbi:ParM/StbA family protein [Ktedonobacteria bacterium brp13]|nr:ParM/StbA family protein [Ktedonobacteria bacterium brp13]
MNFYPTFYGGFDPGSGRAGLKLVSDRGDFEQVLTIDSQIATGNADNLLARGDINATIADVVRPGESLIQFNGADYYLQDLVQEGRNASYALGNPARYWGSHALVLLLTLACEMIHDRDFTLRIVTALPVSLYTKENRQRMKEALTRACHFKYNGIQRSARISVGYVCMEGQGALIHAGLAEGDQALVDIGERTTDLVAANGQKLIVSQCEGNHELGIGMITDAVIALYKRYGRVLSIPKAHDVMNRWAMGEQFADVAMPNGTLPGHMISAAIDKARRALARDIVSFAGSVWNVEGESVGQRFDQITVAGGGAYYLDDLLSGSLPRVMVPAKPEDANLSGYLELARSLEHKIADAWVA